MVEGYPTTAASDGNGDDDGRGDGSWFPCRCSRSGSWVARMVNPKVFFDITMRDAEVGRMEFELRADVSPVSRRTSERFALVRRVWTKVENFCISRAVRF